MDESQHAESAKAYQAFLEYCALGVGRSLSKLAESNQEYAKRIPLFKRWSTQYNWQERVKQYDVEQLAERNASRQKQREEMEERHAREAKEDQELARKFIKTGAEEYHVISLSAVHLLKNSRDDERKALGVDGNQSIGVEIDANTDNVQVVVYYPKLQEKQE